MVNQGWITLHRKMLGWEWYDDANVVRLFIHCLLKSNHAQKKWRGITVESGQFITSQQHLANELSLSIKQIRSALKKLKTTGEVAVKTNNKYSMISIANWSEYQDRDRQADKQKAVQGQSKGSQRSTNNNENNVTKDQPTSSKAAPPTCRHKEIIEIYHEVLPELPRVILQRFNGSAKEKNLKSRWKEDKAHQDLGFWRAYFELVRKNSWWMGDNDRGWKANFEFITKRKNFDNAIEKG